MLCSEVFDLARGVGKLDEFGVSGQEDEAVSGRRGCGEAISEGDRSSGLQPGRLDHPSCSGQIWSKDGPKGAQGLVGECPAMVALQAVVDLDEIRGSCIRSSSSWDAMPLPANRPPNAEGGCEAESTICPSFNSNPTSSIRLKVNLIPQPLRDHHLTLRAHTWCHTWPV